MANIPGVILPGAYTDVVTQSAGVSLPGGTRIAAIIGEGQRSEVLISSALGSGADGFNPTYTSTTTGTDGRHFKTTLYPLISNRTSIYRNGIPLSVLEDTIDSGTFSNLYDCRLEIETGKIELQRSRLIDQGGAYYVASASNVGIGVLNGLTLVDNNAPQETWSIRCISVQRNNSNVPIASTAKFSAFGSVSGTKLDGYGNPVLWTANNQTVSNGILSFAVQETSTVYFREGDSFTVQVYSGVLTKNDSLTTSYIYEGDLNDPLFLQDMITVQQKHGLASTSNTLSLGSQLLFANGGPGVMAVQAAPSVPRRQSYSITSDFRATSTDTDDFVFPLPVGVSPDPNSNIHFFVTNNSTGVETQVLPNKYDFYTLDTAGHATTATFVQDDVLAPSGNSYAYSVNAGPEIIFSGFDGEITRNGDGYYDGYLSSDTVAFDQTAIGQTLKIFDATNVANSGTFNVVSVSNGVIYMTKTAPFSVFTVDTSLSFIVESKTGTSLGTGTDGYIASPSTDTATFGSLTFHFSTITNILTRRISITSGNNIGLYDIMTYDSGTNSVTIKKSFVDETDVTFEIESVDSSLSTAGKYLVVNHNVVPNGYALRVTIVDAKDATFYDAGWINALESLEKVEIDILVPLPRQTISVIFQNALTHCRTMSNIKNRKERVLFCGAINGLTPDNVNGVTDAAVEDLGILEGIQGDSTTEILAGSVEDLTNYSVEDAFGSTFRCVYFYPDQIYVSISGDTTIIDGFYIAAAAAGYLSGTNRVEVPLTNKVLSGFTIPRSRMFSQLTLEQLVQSGITVLQPVAGGGKVVWGKTTTQSGYAEEEEISIIFIRDRIAKSLRSVFEGFIGDAESPQLPALLFGRANSALNAYASQNLITAFANLTVKRDDTDPRQWNISVMVQPVYPVNWIYIKVSVGTI